MKRNYIEDYANPDAAPEIQEAASDGDIPKTPKQAVTLIVISDMPLPVLFKPQRDVMIRSVSSSWNSFGDGSGSVTPMNLITAFLSTALQRLSTPPPLPSRAALDVAVPDEQGAAVFPLIAYICPAFAAMLPVVQPASPALP